MIRVLNAKFISSSPSIKDAAEFALSEVVFLGRSNVGKSSLINALVNQKALAKSSSTPGKTQLINFFEVEFDERDDQSGEKTDKFKIMFVDLPGFGYAKVAKSKHEEWRRNLDEFLKFRSSIKLFVHLIDARHFDLDIDVNVNNYINEFLRPDQKILNFYTKADKLNQSSKSTVLKFDPNGTLVSTLNKVGIDKARELIVTRALGR
ncbi:MULTISPECIES: ribosome biogenesis GTP-binding protein YihA/YsxC [Campylobacter]|uniref:Probable GTP-binding protein EngB n=1 Tax=Campylobacter curvus (strain 525.92) TaxID=360105 RepID=A7GXG6_CAMC5|nr:MULTISPECIES: ribosome biogenesis GTP-binding protein YihA/YsxC [Campylobacter]EAU00711.1 ribosome biogenesis GTP-binding protein YsxC/EngB [Campylobacter curvus 525.92]MBN7287588.1 YihA family ribosome biogenesis GTP-binding protein [Campylobacter curvus]MDU6826540.1 ribosome biogenesis GTP-binding protein YihA/YsxC [Campylobacter sp.]